MLSSYWLYDSLMNDGEIKSRIFLGMSETEKVDEYLFFRIDSISSFISTLFDSWKDYEYRRGENYFLMVFFMTVSQPATFKRNAKGERTMAHIFCKYFETFLDDIFVSLFETSRFVSLRVYQGLFRERK